MLKSLREGFKNDFYIELQRIKNIELDNYENELIRNIKDIIKDLGTLSFIHNKAHRANKKERHKNRDYS